MIKFLLIIFLIIFIYFPIFSQITEDITKLSDSKIEIVYNPFFCGFSADGQSLIYTELTNNDVKSKSYIVFKDYKTAIIQKKLELPEYQMYPVMDRIQLSPDSKYFTFSSMFILPWKMIRAGKPFNLYCIETESLKIHQLTNYVWKDKIPLFYVHNATFTIDSKSMIYQLWSMSEDKFYGTKVIKKNIKTNEEVELFFIDKQLCYCLTLEINNQFLIGVLSSFSQDDTSKVFLYDYSTKEMDILFVENQSNGANQSYWIRDYSNDHKKILLTHFDISSKNNNSHLVMDSVSLLTFDKKGKEYKINNIIIPQNHFITNCLLTKDGRYCLYVLENKNKWNEEAKLLLFDFKNKKTTTLLTAKEIENQTGKLVEVFGIGPIYQNMLDGLFLSNNNDVLLYINNSYRLYKLE